MDNEKFFNFYIENLTNSLNESINKSIVLQTQNRIAAEEINSLSEIIQNYRSENESLIAENNRLKEYDVDEDIIRHKNEITKLLDQISSLKSNNSHVETFRNELIKTRKELETANKTINTLKEQKAKTEKKKEEKKAPKQNTEDDF